MKMHCNALSIFVLITITLLVSACQRELYEEKNIGLSGEERIAFDFTLSEAGVSTDDDLISSVRAIIFDKNGKIVVNDIVEFTTTGKATTVSTEVVRGKNDIYIICNETAELKNKLSVITQKNDVEGITFNGIGVTVPIPMYAKVEDVMITANKDGTNIVATVDGVSSSTLEVKMGYLNAKIGMTVIKNVPTGSVDFSIKRLSYKICRMPKYGTIGKNIAYPKNAGWGDEMNVVGEGTIDISSNGDYDAEHAIPAGVQSIKVPTVYIPEHILTSPENANYCTYLLITADCVPDYGSTVIQAKYRVDLGKLPPTNYNIERGVNYQIYATIRGLGATGLYAEIVPINEYDLPITWKPFEGYAIVGERVGDYGNNTNIWNSYSQYTGILKIVKNRIYSDALFRYGSVVALAAPTTAGAFTPLSDVIWIPKALSINSWDDVKYLDTGDINADYHTPANIADGKGDPCRLVGLSDSEIASDTIDNKLWRMATEQEMRWLETAKNINTTDSRGLYSFSHLLTPFSGYRDIAGDMTPSANGGYYWSSTGAKSLIFNADNSLVIGTDDTKKAYTIRCIRTDIPESVFVASAFEVDYTGGTGNIAMSDLGSVLVPHWKVALKNSEDASIVTLGKTELTNKEMSVTTIKPLENPYIFKRYEVVINGYGLDGKVHEVNTYIFQRSLIHDVSITFVSNPELTLVDGYYNIPKGGATLSISMKITPEPFISIYPDYKSLLWHVKHRYHTDVLNVDYGSSALSSEISTIVIPENTYGHALGHELSMEVIDHTNCPPYSSLGIVLTQDK